MQPLHKVWVKYFVFVQHVPFKECKALCKHHLVEAYYSHMLQVSCILILPIDRLRNRVTSMLEEESGTCELHQMNRLLYPTDFLCEFLPVTSTTQCLYCASEVLCLCMRLRLLQSFPKMNMNRYKTSKEWSTIPQEDLLETQVSIGLCLPVLSALILQAEVKLTLTMDFLWSTSELWSLSWSLISAGTSVFKHGHLHVVAGGCPGPWSRLACMLSFHFCNTPSLTAFHDREEECVVWPKTEVRLSCTISEPNHVCVILWAKWDSVVFVNSPSYWR